MKTPAYTLVKDTPEQVGHSVIVRGWVHSLRDMGKISFLDLRDQTGLLQIVCVSDEVDLPKLGTEYVVEIEGEIRKRGERFINNRLVTGEVELGATRLTVLATSQELPFELTKDTRPVHEETRLKYRYLDLRTERMAANLRLRHEVIKFIRGFYDQAGFIEVETPALNRGTPEGAREFIIPARQHPGEFYVLPQSPQQFKQLLMVAGIGKYFQIARCFRDEDQRGDRQPEFTQLDVEMSFVSQEDILQQTEQLIIDLVTKVTPEKHFTKLPFPRMTYAESMEKYGSDKPDLRQDKTDENELAFAWVLDFPMFETDKQTKGLTAVHHPFTKPKTEDLKLLKTEPLKARADAYDVIANGSEIGGGSIRINNADLQTQVFELLGLSEAEIQDKFGHMLEAFTYGVPPHGGIAWGLDRFIMLLAGEANIREVMAFPKTGDARDPLMNAPSPLAENRLLEAHIQIASTPKKPTKD